MTKPKYKREFFETRQSTAHLSAESVARWVYELLAPKSVLDVGCGTGGWLAAFRRLGVADVLGVDGDWVPRDRLEISAEEFRAVDLCLPLSVGRQFDLAICMEVVEHLPSAVSEQIVESLTSVSPVILFSAAIPHQGGTGHVNEQWQSYWIRLFEEKGYECVDCLRGKFWNDEKVAWWYAENAFFFVAVTAEAQLARLRAEAQKFPMAKCDVVHPALFEARIRELSSPDSYSLSGMLKEIPYRFLRAVRRRFINL